MDRLAALLNRFELRANVFHTGALCSQVAFDASQGVGYVHVLRGGAMRVETTGEQSIDASAPALLFYVKPATHRLLPVRNQDPELVCGSIDFGAGPENPLARALPRPVLIPLVDHPSLTGLLNLLFGEAFGQHCGRQAALDRLCELLVIQLLRHLMDRGQVDAGLLAGLADSRLSKALNAMHEQPAEAWTLGTLASRAGMSRARFAVHFRETIGVTPGEYLVQWRLGLAQSLLRHGKPVSLIADEVGYSGAAALARAFNHRFGLSPRTWLKQHSASAE